MSAPTPPDGLPAAAPHRFTRPGTPAATARVPDSCVICGQPEAAHAGRPPEHEIRIYLAEPLTEPAHLSLACLCGRWQATLPDGAPLQDIAAAAGSHLAPGVIA